MTSPLGTITNTLGNVTTDQVISANDWNNVVGGIYTYINNNILAKALNLFNNTGDLLVHDGTNLNALGVGANGTVLTADNTQAVGIKWAPQAASQLTTNGDMLIYNGGLQRLPIGTAGQIMSSVGGIPTWSSNTPFGVVPIGGIILWSGALNTVPANFQVCDGTNGTPNLQGLFVVGAGGTSPAATGGMGLLNPGGPSGDNSFAAGKGPAHSHTMIFTTANSFGNGSQGAVVGGVTAAATITPKYYALAYIMRMS